MVAERVPVPAAEPAETDAMKARSSEGLMTTYSLVSSMYLTMSQAPLAWVERRALPNWVPRLPERKKFTAESDQLSSESIAAHSTHREVPENLTSLEFQISATILVLGASEFLSAKS